MIILKKKVEGVSEAGLNRFLGLARRAAGVEGRITVLITSNKELHDLNRRFRHKDAATDVLSFPALAAGWAGDIAISAELARDYAKQMGHTIAEELRVLILHGVLHLAGYDHHGPDMKMARLESRLRRQLGLPAGLIERAAAQAGPGVGRRVPARQAEMRSSTASRAGRTKR